MRDDRSRGPHEFPLPTFPQPRRNFENGNGKPVAPIVIPEGRGMFRAVTASACWRCRPGNARTGLALR